MPFYEVLTKVRLTVHAESLGEAVKTAETLDQLSLIDKNGTKSSLVIHRSEIYGINATASRQ